MDKIALDKEVKQLILEAKRNNITDKEIDKCLEETYKQLQIKHKKRRSKCCVLLGWLCTLSLCFILCLVLFYAAVSSSKEAQKVVGPYVIGHITHITKPMRKVAIYMTQYADRFQWYTWHADDCLIDNPYKAEQEVHCEVCRYIEHVVKRQSIDTNTFENNFHNRIIPFKVHSAEQVPVSFTQIRDNYQAYSNLSKMGINWIKSTSTNLRNVTDFMQEMTEIEIMSQRDFHAEWHMKRAGPSAFLRKMFPMPNFIPSSAEVSLQQVLVIDSTQSPAQAWPNSQHSSMVYVQGYGQREIHFTPHDKCTDICKYFSVAMETGDILYADTFHWKIETTPVSSLNVNRELSIALIRSVL